MLYGAQKYNHFFTELHIINKDFEAAFVRFVFEEVKER
jgi:hypothetical protein